MFTSSFFASRFTSRGLAALSLVGLTSVLVPVAAQAQSYSLTLLGALPGGISSYGQGVNNSGQVAGYGYTASYNPQAFLSGVNGGALKDLGTLGGTSSYGQGVNASGQVVGDSNTASGDTHAFLSGPNGGALTDLGLLPGGNFSQGEGINDSGQVVGESAMVSGDSTYNASAFLFANGVMLDLNSLIAPGSGFTLQDAKGISDTGFITGYGSYSGGQAEAFLLTPLANPVPEASTTVSLGLLLALGMGGLLVARRKKLAAQV